MNINPVETIYNGYRFRSRLEARWAVFFDAAEIRYQYEPEGFKLSNGMYYLPDFFLENVHLRRGGIGLYVEVKGNMTKEDTLKIEAFAKARPILVVGQIPQSGETNGTESNNLYWNLCTIDGDDYPAVFVKKIDGTIGVCGLDNDWFCNPVRDSERLLPCYDCARQARFEHGDTPRVQPIKPKRTAENDIEYFMQVVKWENLSREQKIKSLKQLIQTVALLPESDYRQLYSYRVAKFTKCRVDQILRYVEHERTELLTVNNPKPKYKSIYNNDPKFSLEDHCSFLIIESEVLNDRFKQQCSPLCQ